MSREIKFRAWDNEKKKMYLVYAIDWSDGEIISAHLFDGIEGRKVYPNKEMGDDIEFMQYTGLKDKNGKDIFEGDFVQAQTPYSTAQPKLVIWDSKRAGFFLKCDFVAYDSKNLYKMSGFKMEVIGNIYENPELVKDK
jgi:uncharacterized phage protein (TIGR01671 family)